jgi:hypothetical protein
LIFYLGLGRTPMPYLEPRAIALSLRLFFVQLFDAFFNLLTMLLSILPLPLWEIPFPCPCPEFVNCYQYMKDRNWPFPASVWRVCGGRERKRASLERW